jgi:hypothetical protein
MHDDDSIVQREWREQVASATSRAKWERPALVRLMANEALSGDGDNIVDDDTVADTS